MEQLTINHSNGNSTTYKLFKGNKDMPIAYHAETTPLVVNALENARVNGYRVKIYLGDVATGKCWNEEHDIFGYVRLSKGKTAYYPILVYNVSSYGGGSILDHCIVKIRESKGNRVLYQAHNFKQPICEVKESTENGYTHSLYINGELYSNHKSERAAKILQNKMS